MSFLDKIKTFATPKRKKEPSKPAKQNDEIQSAISFKQDGWLQTTQSLGHKEPKDWRYAREAYALTDRPRNDYLQDVYDDALLDSHLQAVQQKRLLSLQNKDFVLRRADGEVDEEKSKWLEQSWFRQLVGWVLESRFYGYSLIWIAEANPTSGELILQRADRRRVVPQTGYLRIQADTDEGGIRYGDYPDTLLFACLGREKGLLESASLATLCSRATPSLHGVSLSNSSACRCVLRRCHQCRAIRSQT